MTGRLPDDVRGSAPVERLRSAARAGARAARRTWAELARWLQAPPDFRADRLGWLATALAVLVTGLIAVLVAVPTASTKGSLGPHRATYSMTTSGVIDVDLGPLGALVLDSPLPWPLGVQVRVQEIPADLGAAGGDPVSSLAGDLDGYLQFFAQPDLAIRDAARDLADDAARRVVLAWSVLLVLAAAGRLASRRGAFRVEIGVMLSRPGVAVLLVVAVLASGVGLLRDWRSAPRGEGRLSAVLAGTPLADARIVGRLGDIVDTYGGYALDAIERNRQFYDAAAGNLVAAYEADPEAVAPVPYAVAKSLLPREDGTGGSADATSETTTGPGAEATTGPTTDPLTVPTRAPATEPEPADGDDLVTFLVVADLHCNVGMATVVERAVRLSEADAVLNAGDTVISGTSVEQFCVTALAEAVPPGIPLVVADGNHDSNLTSSQERRAGNIVLAGEPVTVAGVRILGDAEPILTTVTEGVRLRAGETRAEMGLRLAERACRSREAGDPIDILLLHNPRAGVTPMASGCVVLQLSGHFHRTVGPTHQGLGLLYAAGSTAGATAGKTSIGPLESPGVMTVMRYDPVAHRPVDYRIVTVGTDGEVDLGRWAPFPEPPVAPVAAELDLPDPLPVASSDES